MNNLMDLPEELRLNIAQRMENFPDLARLALTNSEWLRVCRTVARDRLREDQKSENPGWEENRMEEDCDPLAIYHRSVRNRRIDQSMEYTYLLNFDSDYSKSPLCLDFETAIWTFAHMGKFLTLEGAKSLVKTQREFRENVKKQVVLQAGTVDESVFKARQQEIQKMTSRCLKKVEDIHLNDIIYFRAMHLFEAMMESTTSESLKREILIKALFSAVAQNAGDMMRRLFQQFPEQIQQLKVNVSRGDYTLLTLAVHKGHVEMLEFLLQKKILDVNTFDGQGLTALHHCVLREKEGRVRGKISITPQCAQMAAVLLREGASIEIECDDRADYDIEGKYCVQHAQSAWAMCLTHRTPRVKEVLSRHMSDNGLTPPSDAMDQSGWSRCVVS